MHAHTMYLFCAGDTAVIGFLLSKGAKANATNARGETPLHVAYTTFGAGVSEQRFAWSAHLL